MQFNDIAKAFIKKELPDSEVELVGEVPAEAIVPYREQALAHLAEHVELPGFRPGHVPLDMVAKKVGEITVLEEALELYMREFYPALLEAHNIDAVGRPDIRITKLAPENPVGLTIRATIYPTVVVPKDWKKLGEGIEMETVPEILDAEVDEALLSIRRARAKIPTATTDSTPTPEADVAEETDSSAVSQQGNATESISSAPDTQLPELDDAFAQSLGQFTDVADLKAKLKENMKSEKEQQAKEKRRGKIIDSLLEKTKTDVPVMFVDSELEKILNQLKEDVKRFGLSFEDYLTRMQKTEEQVRADFREQARKRAKLQLTLNKIAAEEKIEVDQEAVATEMKHALEHFPDARPDLVQVHIETVMRNEKVLKMLEGELEKE